MNAEAKQHQATGELQRRRVTLDQLRNRGEAEGSDDRKDAVAEGGADWETIRIRDVATGTDLGDDVSWVRFSDLSWTHDSKGFFYSRYPAPPPNKVLEAALAHQAVYYHRIGTPQSDDLLIYERDSFKVNFRHHIVEDDPYNLIRYEGEGEPALFDYTGKSSVYMSSFSKSIAPALRVGDRVAWYQLPEEVGHDR